MIRWLAYNLGVRHLFVSDLHLDAATPRANAAFHRFLETEARAANTLFVLGDLFDSWIGDDDDDPTRDALCQSIAALSAAGVDVAVMHGNRDFLYGSEFERRTGARVLPDPSVVTLFDRRVLLCHGDLLCTADRAYQELRTTVREPAFRSRMAKLSREQRRWLANAARAGSKAHVSTTRGDIMDVTESAVVAAFEATQTNEMVHGHTHRPGEHAYRVGTNVATRHVLDVWDDCGGYLELTAAGWRRGVVAF